MNYVLIALMTLALLGLSPAAGSASTAADNAGQPPSVLKVAVLQDIDSLNPFLGISASVVQIFALTYDRLTDYRAADNQPVPGLATGWKTSSDHRTWTFTIRSGVRWSDGQPLTAADIAFTYNTIMKHPATVNASQVKSFTSVTAPDARTVVITTRVPTSTMLALDIPIVPAHIWEHLDPMAEPSGDVTRWLIGSGPFRVTLASPGQEYRLQRSPTYWGTAPGMSTVVLRYFADSDAAAQALRKGEIDLVGNLTPAQFGALAKDRSISTDEAEGTRYTDLVFNAGAARSDGTSIGDGHPALHDQRVRAAIEYAIDRRSLVNRVLDGHGKVGEAYFPPSYAPWSWQPDPGVRRDFNPATANRMLDEAGYRRGSDGVRTMPAGGPGAGHPLKFRLFVPVERAHYAQSALYLTQWLKDVGITIETTRMADSQISDRVAAGSYDLFLGGWILDPDPDYQLSIQICAARPDAQGNGSSNGFTCDPTVDRLYEKQAEQIDATERVRTVQQIQQRMYEIVPQIMLYYPGVLEAYRNDRVTNLQRRPAATGSIIGNWSYRVARPVTAADQAQGSSGLWIVLPILVILILGLLVILVRFRRRSRALPE
jgi:peptide/nickel transport system substrate-binding protein